MVDREYIINNLIPRFLELVRNEFDVNRSILYGSYVNGIPNDNSDIDVALILTSYNKEKRFEITNRLFRLARMVDIRIEPRCLFAEEVDKAEKASIIFDIVSKGIVIN
jgi:predicted nucleotidyltransferase